MPGLPRKSTAKQFSKLMKKSGKSRTNTASGAYDTSKIKISTKENMIVKFSDFLNEGKKNELENYFSEIIRLFRDYKDLSVREAKQIVQEYNDLIIEEFKKGTPANKVYKDITYLVGDI